MNTTIQLSVVLCVLFTICILVETRQLGCRNGDQLIEMKSLDYGDKQRILDIHNKLRNRVASGQEPGQPPAEFMMELTWDKYAEKQAYHWANGCVFAHNSPKDKENRPMGQNLFMRMESGKKGINATFNTYIESMVQGWYDEVKLYNFGSPFSSATGHYTQVVWAKSAKVGCGLSYFKEGMWYHTYLVCNYSPAGNYLGETPYIRGKVDCEKHNLLSSRKYDSLCV